MIFDASVLFMGFAMGFFFGSFVVLIKTIISWFVTITAR